MVAAKVKQVVFLRPKKDILKEDIREAQGSTSDMGRDGWLEGHRR